MKKTILVLGAFTLLLAGVSTSYAGEPVKTFETEESTGSSFKLINDTGDKVSIHTGSGFVTLNKGGSTSISCNVGKEVRFADSGKKGDVIFEIESSHCGETLKLSDFL